MMMIQSKMYESTRRFEGRPSAWMLTRMVSGLQKRERKGGRRMGCDDDALVWELREEEADGDGDGGV